MTRAEVYAALDGERDYQNAQWAKLDATSNTPADFIGYVKTYVGHAEGALSSDDPSRVLHQLRKVAALCVACLEKNGCPPRA
jgi:hypothetical protein